MSIGTFSSLGRAYLRAASSCFAYVGQAPLFLKLPAFLLALLYAPVLVGLGLGFFLFIALDWMGSLVDGLRKHLLRFLEYQSWHVDDSLFSFLLRPLVIGMIAPLFFLSLLMPKLSSPAADMVLGEVAGILDGSGAFARINRLILRIARRLFLYVAKAPLLLIPITALIAVCYATILIPMGLFFILLLPLDWLSHLVEAIRLGVIRFCDRRGQSIRFGFGSFLLMPLILLVLAPVFLALLLVPKTQ